MGVPSFILSLLEIGIHFINIIFWVVTLCNVVDVYRRIGETRCLHRQDLYI
jgi:hypothetical protein